MLKSNVQDVSNKNCLQRVPLAVVGVFPVPSARTFSPTANRCKCIKQELSKELQARTDAQ